MNSIEREWDREEVVVLVCEYFRTKWFTKEETDASYHFLSDFLRARETMLTGRPVTDTFRNYAGIRMQSGRIRCLDPDSHYSGMQGTKLQKAIVQEYLENPAELTNEADRIFEKYADHGDLLNSSGFDSQLLVKAIPIPILRRMACAAKKVKPERMTVSSLRYFRDQSIAQYTKYLAKGICQLCGQKAPFCTRDGEPYLEAHHIEWLSQGGEDSLDNCVALCPNCHRKMHELNNEEDVLFLKNVVLKRVAEP